MAEDQIPEGVMDRLKKMFGESAVPLTPTNVAMTLQALGWMVSDEAVLRAYDAVETYIRCGTPQKEDPAVTEAKAFLEDHQLYERWKYDVANGRTLGGFFEWREQQ